MSDPAPQAESQTIPVVTLTWNYVCTLVATQFVRQISLFCN